MLHVNRVSRLRLIVAGLCIPLLNACGDDSSSAQSVSTTTIVGSAVAGAVDGTVRVRTATGTQLATASVTKGEFSVVLLSSALADELDFEVTGTYTDEVSSTDVILTETQPLALRVAAGALHNGTTAQVGITPETSVIRALVVQHGLSLADAQAAYASALGVTPDGAARPFDPTAPIPTRAINDSAARDAAFRAGTWSEWGRALGLSGDQLAALPGAIGEDLSDGVLDGAADGIAVSVDAIDLHTLHERSPLAARYLTAMANFAGNANANVAVLSAPTSGLPANARVTEIISDTVAAQRIVTLADESQIRVQVQARKMAPFPGTPITAHTNYRMTVTDVATGAPVDVTAGGTVQAINIGSMMHMLSGRHHTTPTTSTYHVATSNPAAGEYDFSVYYVMASAMKVGDVVTPMGLWDLRVDFTTADGTAVALFHPNVTMVMGAVLSSRGGDAGDQVPDPNNPGTTMARPYWVWLDRVEANGTGGHDVGLYFTSKVGALFPAIYDGVNHTSMGDALNVADANLEISTDQIVWVPMDEDGAGRYTIAGLDGLVVETPANVWVRATLTIGDSEHRVLLATGSDPKLVFTAP